MKSQRLTWIDYARGIAIILVVYRHVFQGIKESGINVQPYLYLEYANIFFFSFRMPLFFIVSGIFVAGSLRKAGIKKFITTRAKTILYPYFLWASIQLTLQVIFSKYTNGHPTASSYLNLLYLPREVAQFWYLYALFNVAVVYAVAKVILRIGAVQNMGIGILLFYASVLAYQYHLDLGFLADIMHYYLFFAIGDTISSFMLDRNNFRQLGSYKWFIVLCCCFALAQTYFLTTNLSHAVDKYQFVEYYQPLAFLVIAIIGCAFIINLTFILQKKMISHWLTVLGRHSLYIYVAHVIVFAAARIFLKKFMGIENVPVLLTTGIVAGLIIPILLYKLCIKLKMPWLFTLAGKTAESSPAPGAHKLTLSSPVNDLNK